MEQLQTTIVNGVISILVVLIGLAFTGVKGFIETKAAELKAKTDTKNYELAKSIAHTVVGAVEQIFKDVHDASQDKFQAAFDNLTKELEKAGINLDDASKKVLIESVVNGFNELKKIEG
jgi:hypothetical protein|nr:MAG TPA: holin [Caudoviricetes sp.]